MTSYDIGVLMKEVLKEERRAKLSLHMTANENTLSPLARRALSSELSDRYYNWSMQDPICVGNFMHRGMPGVAMLQEQATRAACTMLDAYYVDMRPLSGMTSMLLATVISSEPGECIMTVPVEVGGHFLTEGMLRHIGRRQLLFPCKGDGSIDVKRSAAIVKEHGVTACLLDRSYLLSRHPVRELREAVGEEVVIVYDASQVLGLIMGGEFQNPFSEGADLLTANTHKTFPGPHKAIIATRESHWGQRAREVIDNSFVSTQHTHHAIALFITMLEMEEFGREYAQRIVSNANALGHALEALGLSVRRVGDIFSTNHQVHLVCPVGEGREWHRRLSACDISTNRDILLDGMDIIRFGVQDITRRGMDQAEMSEIARLIFKIIGNGRDAEVLQRSVHSLVSAFREARYCFLVDDEV